MQRRMMCVLAASLLFPAGNVPLAADYWSYSYKGFDVTTDNSGYTVSLAHNLARFDTALTRILQLPERRVPTHIYELSGKQMQELMGVSSGVSYKFSGYEVSVVTATGDTAMNRYWGALFGYTGSLLVNGRASRAPYWFQEGVPELFAHSEFQGAKIMTGDVASGYVQRLVGSTWIPMRTFLRMQATDPQLSSSGFQGLFYAESWYLAHEIYVEDKLRSEFGQYLGLMRAGKSEADAYAASFKLSYEDLDKLLQHALREPAHMFIVEVPSEPADGQRPRKLSDSEIKAQLAYLNLQWGHRAEALRLAMEALQGDLGGELALRVLARANLQEGKFGEARTAVDRLEAHPSLSAAALTDDADVLVELGRASSKEDPPGGDAPALLKRAEAAYERAVGLDSDYLRAWAGLAYLFGSQRDGPAAQALVTRAQPVMEKHLDCGALARALANMCAQTGQTSCAFLFGEYWRDDAISQHDLDQALAFMARLHSQ